MILINPRGIQGIAFALFEHILFCFLIKWLSNIPLYYTAESLFDPCCETDPVGMGQMHLNKTPIKNSRSIKHCPE